MEDPVNNAQLGHISDKLEAITVQISSLQGDVRVFNEQMTHKPDKDVVVDMVDKKITKAISNHVKICLGPGGKSRPKQSGIDWKAISMLVVKIVTLLSAGAAAGAAGGSIPFIGN